MIDCALFTATATFVVARISSPAAIVVASIDSNFVVVIFY
jgi:hypothetical protein